MSTAADNDYRVVLVLMKGTDADATIDALEASGQTVDIKDEGPYWKLRSNDDIVVQMEAVEEELGAPISLAKWLVSMTSFVGYADTSDSHFAVRVDRGVAVDRSA